MSAPATTGVTPAVPVTDMDRRVLGAGTTLRFVLLVVLVIASSLQLILVQLILIGASGGPVPFDACVLATGGVPGNLDMAGLVRIFESDTRGALESCLRRNTHVPWWWLAGGLGAIVVLTALAYWLSPRWKRRGGRLVPVQDAELSAELAGLVCEAGLDTAPDFVLNPVAASPSAVVFGHWRAQTVVLHAGLIARRDADPDGFRRVVLHELAHIRNGDVGIAYATEALWRVFMILVLLPYTVRLVNPWGGPLLSGNVHNPWLVDWRLELRELLLPAFLAVLVLLARADVLRTRELYADLDASRWSGARSLPDPTGTESTRGVRGALRRFAALWRTHPAWAERAESLLDPAALFGVRATTMFLTGAAATTVVSFLSTIEPESPISGASSAQLPVWTVAALITGIVGVALWRSVAHAVLTGGRVPTGLQAGCWLGLGVAAGELLTFAHSGSAWLPSAPYVLLLLVAGVAALIWWVTQCAEVWILTCRGRTLRAVHLIGLAAMLAVFGALFEWWYTGGFAYLAGNTFVTYLGRMAQEAFPEGTAAQRNMLRPFWPAIGAVSGATAAIPLLVGGSVLWLFPLAAWARRPVEGRPPWARRALPGGDVLAGGWPVLPPLRTALGPGVAGGALAVCAVAAVRLWLHAHRGSGSTSGLSVTISQLWFVIALCAVTGVTAALTYWRAPRHPLPIAFVAASTAMLVGLAGTFGLGATDGCVPQLAYLGRTCGWKTSASWGVLRTLLAPIALGLGFYATVIAAPLGLALRAVATWRRDPAVRGFEIPGAAEPVRSGWRTWIPAVGAGTGLGVGSVAVATGWQGAVRSASPTTAWLFRAYEWIGFALTLAMIASAFLAARTARRRGPWQRAAAALTAAAAALAAGTATAWAVTATDGCVPHFDVILAQCAWRPHPAWLLVSTVAAPTALTLVLCTAAIVIISMVAWRAVGGRATTTVETRVLRPWSARVYLLVACALTLGMVAGTWQQFAEARGGPAPRFIPGPASPTPTASRRVRFDAWVVTGGDVMMKSLNSQVDVFSAALDAAARSRQVDPKVFGPVCDAWVAEGRKMLAGPPVPDTSLQTRWHQIAQQAVQGGTECAQGIRDNDSARFDAGEKQIVDLIAKFEEFLRKATKE